ncbi:MAG: hypothetical protein C0616_10030 [Desulfuromonas sp.]|nr:MAG: hypothetical protein C0616_10030 [Desulfuromonas sp.]
MKAGKIILVVIGLIIVVIAAAVFFLVQNLDSIVKAGIEKFGSEAAGTAVRVESVDIGLQEGRGSILGLSVSNPPGFSGGPLFSLGEITLDIDTATVTKKVPVIEVIRIGQTGFQFVVDAKGETNLGMLKKNISRSSSSGKSETTTGEQAPIRLRVKRLTVADGQGSMDLTAVGGEVLEGGFKGFTLTDIGGREGITPQGLGEKVLEVLIARLEQSAARQGAEKMIREKFGKEAGRLQENLDEKLGPGAGDTLKKMFGQ